MTVLKVGPDSTAADIREALTYLSKRAQHEQALVARYTTDEPTEWDARHEAIDRLLVDLERASA